MIIMSHGVIFLILPVSDRSLNALGHLIIPKPTNDTKLVNFFYIKYLDIEELFCFHGQHNSTNETKATMLKSQCLPSCIAYWTSQVIDLQNP